MPKQRGRYPWSRCDLGVPTSSYVLHHGAAEVSCLVAYATFDLARGHAEGGVPLVSYLGYGVVPHTPGGRLGDLRTKPKVFIVHGESIEP
jgi:hypothetical protein